MASQSTVTELASALDADIRTLPVQNTAGMRAVRRTYSRRLSGADPEFILDLARELIENHGHRWLAYELIRYHHTAFESLGEADLEILGLGINSWGAVDAFARILSGPAWLHGQVPDELVYRWAHSEDRWWRRAALVSTVALNARSHGGQGDAPRTLAVCRLLVADRDDMVVKAMSWALREVVSHDPEPIQTFLNDHDEALAARVKREVRNKLATGLKDPG